jgi:hypothetical protein
MAGIPFPDSATVVSETNATWINADVNMTYGITLSSGEDGQTVFSNSSIPYLNGTTYMFQQEGEYIRLQTRLLESTAQ